MLLIQIGVPIAIISLTIVAGYIFIDELKNYRKK